VKRGFQGGIQLTDNVIESETIIELDQIKTRRCEMKTKRILKKKSTVLAKTEECPQSNSVIMRRKSIKV